MNEIDLSRSALIVVDLQVGTTSGVALAHPVEDVVGRVNSLANAFRAHGRPVIWASVQGTPAGKTTYFDGTQTFPRDWSALAPELVRAESDFELQRMTWSAFADTGLHNRLRASGADTVVIAGVATSFGVESTARSAYDLGYTVVVPADAVTDRSIEAHDNTIARILPALGVLMTTTMVIADL